MYVINQKFIIIYIINKSGAPGASFGGTPGPPSRSNELLDNHIHYSIPGEKGGGGGPVTRLFNPQRFYKMSSREDEYTTRIYFTTIALTGRGRGFGLFF